MNKLHHCTKILIQMGKLFSTFKLSLFDALWIMISVIQSVWSNIKEELYGGIKCLNYCLSRKNVSWNVWKWSLVWHRIANIPFVLSLMQICFLSFPPFFLWLLEYSCHALGFDVCVVIFILCILELILICTDFEISFLHFCVWNWNCNRKTLYMVKFDQLFVQLLRKLRERRK